MPRRPISAEQKLASLPNRDQEARGSLGLALRLGDGAAAFEACKLSGATPAQAAAMTKLRPQPFASARCARGCRRGLRSPADIIESCRTSLRIGKREALRGWYRKAAQLGQTAAVVWVARLLGNPDTPLFDRTAAWSNNAKQPRATDRSKLRRNWCGTLLMPVR